MWWYFGRRVRLSEARYYDAGIVLAVLVVVALVLSSSHTVSRDAIDRGSLAVVEADLNGDGREEIVAVDNGAQRLLLYRPENSNRYRRHLLFTVEAPQTSASLRLSTSGEASIGLDVVIPMEPRELALRLVDYNEDGALDIELRDMRGTTWLLNDGSGGFKRQIREWQGYGVIEVNLGTD